jgi:monoamine oxidase
MRGDGVDFAFPLEEERSASVDFERRVLGDGRVAVAVGAGKFWADRIRFGGRPGGDARGGYADAEAGAAVRVGIVGAGAAGLMAARTLKRAGHQAVVIERNTRLGGRIWTKNDGERWFDPGGEWIDADHSILIGLAKEFGLELEEAPERPRRFHFEGGFEEEPLGSNERDFNSAVKFSKKFKNCTLAEFLDEGPFLTPRGREWMYCSLRSDEGEELREIDFEGWRDGYMRYLERTGNEPSAYRLREGMGAMVSKLAEGVEIRHREATEIVQKQDLVRIGDDVFDAAIVAVPITAVSQLAFTPKLGIKQARAWESGRMSRSVKVCLHFKTAWWEAQGWSGSGLFTSLVQQTWVGTRANAEPTLTAYINGDDAQSLHEEPGTAVTRVLADLVRYYPMSASEFVRGEFIDWIEIAGGGFSIRAPGFFKGSLPSLRKPHGRVAFAGEHLGSWYGFIEGALESGVAAANQVMEWQ